MLALDQVQKKLSITDDAIRYLRQKRIIEDRKPALYVSARIAAATATMADYVHTRGQDDEFYGNLLTEYFS